MRSSDFFARMASEFDLDAILCWRLRLVSLRRYQSKPANYKGFVRYSGPR